MSVDHYQTLGVERTASEDEIKKAYRKKAMKHHPDRGGNEAEFKKIEEAYRILSDPRQRQQYDHPQPQFNFHQTQGGPFDFDSIFEIFGTRFQQGQQHNQRTQRVTIWLHLEDVARGGQKLVTVATMQGHTTLEINIPQGVQDGENVRYPKLSPGGGDLIVSFRVHPHPVWQRDGLDIYCEHALNFWQLIAGTDITVKDIFGNELIMTVPPRTRPNTLMRARYKGIARQGHNNGDLLVKLTAQMPQEIPEEIIQIIEQKSLNK